MGLKDSLFFGEEGVALPCNTIKILQFEGIVIVQLHCPFLYYSTSWKVKIKGFLGSEFGHLLFCMDIGSIFILKCKFKGLSIAVDMSQVWAVLVYTCWIPSSWLSKIHRSLEANFNTAVSLKHWWLLMICLLTLQVFSCLPYTHKRSLKGNLKKGQISVKSSYLF